MEEFTEKGIAIQVPVEKNMVLLSDHKQNPIYYLGAILEQCYDNIKNKKSLGSLENIKAVRDNKVSFALCNEKIFVDHFLGNNQHSKNKDLEFVMAYFHEHIYCVSKDELSPKDLSGKKVWVGSTKNTSFFYLKIFANIYGYGLKEDDGEIEDRVINFITGPLTENLINFISDDATIDALFIVSGPKLRYLMDINKINIGERYIISEFTDDYFESLMGSLLKKDALNVELYNDPTKNYKNLYGSRVILICNKHVEDNVVYDFVKNIIKKKYFLLESMMQWGAQTFDDDIQDYAYHYHFKTPEMLACPPNIKIHNGTRRYMKEIGLITKDPNMLCEFDHENNRCDNVNPRWFSKKPLWKLKEVDFPSYVDIRF